MKKTKKKNKKQKDKALYASCAISILFLLISIVLSIRGVDCPENVEFACLSAGINLLLDYVIPCYIISLISAIVTRTILSVRFESPKNKTRKDLKWLSVINMIVFFCSSFARSAYWYYHRHFLDSLLRWRHREIVFMVK